ncbi:MAG: ATP-binding protein [bacterium]
MNRNPLQRLWAQLARFWRVPYEIRVRIAVGVLFIFVLASALNAIRFLNESRSAQAHDWSYRSARSLELITDFLATSTEERLAGTRLRELVQAAGFAEVEVVESDALRADQDTPSSWVDAEELRQLRQVFSLDKEVVGRVSDAPPALATVPYRRQGSWNCTLFQPFVNEAGENLTLVVGTRAELTAHLDEFWWMTLLFEGLSLAATTAVALLLLQITFAPYKRIRKEAIAAAVAEPQSVESVDFAVDTFLKVIADLRVKERRLQRLYAQQRDRAAHLERYNDYILESMPSGVISCDVTGTVTQVNRSAARLLRFDPRLTVGGTYRSALAGLPQLVQLFDTALQTGEEIALKETKLPVAAGHSVAVSIVCRLLHDDAGGVRGAMILINDLTLIKRLEEEVSWREQMAALGEMSAGLAHQLRNSLGAMVGFGQLLTKLTRGEGQAEQIANSILSEAEVTEKMLRQFLGYASPGKVKLDEISLKDLFADLREFLRFDSESGKIQVRAELSACDDVLLATDPLLLSHALQNLIQNGIDACKSTGGEVSLTGQIGAEQRDKLLLVVTDTGQGIAPENLGKIFNPFYTSGKAEGTGLGLALARKWIAALGGEITCTSELGRGSSFVISLPICHAPEAAFPNGIV